MDIQRAQIESEGYDGIVLDVPGWGRENVAFRPNQIKSAAGNRSLLAEDPDIRYSAADNWQQSPVAREVAKAFKAAASSDRSCHG